jgi:hypothetical protein
VDGKDVFLGCSFYSLEAVMGGALYLNQGMNIKSCRFANNTAENNNGNDVYINNNTDYYSDSTTTQNTCSLSLLPGQFKTNNVFFCFFLFFF